MEEDPARRRRVHSEYEEGVGGAVQVDKKRRSELNGGSRRESLRIGCGGGSFSL